MSPDDVERQLRERARRLAATPHREEADDEIEVLSFRLRNEEYAAEMRLLRAVHPVDGLTPVPCTPPHVAGILNVRGEIITVLDLGAALGLGPGSRSETQEIVLADRAGTLVGLLVDEVHGVERMSLHELDRSPTGSELVRGIVMGRIVLLRVERLVSGDEFEVFEEVG